MKFDPEKAEAEARKYNPAFDTARTRQESEKQKYLAPVIEYFGRLEEEIISMPIAQRFSRDHGLNFTAGGTPEEQILLQYHNLSEAEYKRAQLLVDLRTLRGKAMNLIGGVEGLIMDMEATKLD